jgi:hypothetical protein
MMYSRWCWINKRRIRRIGKDANVAAIPLIVDRLLSRVAAASGRGTATWGHE